MKTFILIPLLVVLASCGLKDMDDPGNLVPKTVAEDPNLPSIAVNGTTLHAETFGDINNPILILSHGGPGSDYRALISEFGEKNASRYPDERTGTNSGLTRLQDEFFLVFYDQRGAGLSTRYDKGVMDFEMYVADMDAVIDYYIEKKETETGVLDTQVNLFGWSYGGLLSTGYINVHPEKVKDVILFEPGPFTKDALDYFIENSSNVFDAIGEDWLEEFLLSKDHITSDSHERADFAIAIGASRAQPELHEHPDTPFWRIGAFLRGDNLNLFESDNYNIASNIKTSFSGRMLYVNGSLETDEYPDYSDMQRQHYLLSEYVEIENTGHSGPWEKSAELSMLIRDFLNN